MYILKHVTTKAEMDLVMDVIWAANYEPYDPVIQLFFPVLGYGSSDVDEAKAKGAQRLWDTHEKMGTSSNWLYVEEVTTGMITGCAQWELHRKTPFPPIANKTEIPWWPKGTRGREFCEQILRQVYGMRTSWMARPHMALNWMCCIPSHRRQGIGSMIMEWGVDKADELGLEAYLEASAMGKPLYGRFDFGVLVKIAYDTTREDADGEWRRLEHDLTPLPFHAMWRPRNGEWENCKMPWELGRQ